MVGDFKADVWFDLCGVVWEIKGADL